MSTSNEQAAPDLHLVAGPPLCGNCRTPVTQDAFSMYCNHCQIQWRPDAQPGDLGRPVFDHN